MEEHRERFLTEEHNKKRLLEDNLKDMRELIRISKKINESQEYIHNFELNQKGIELDEKKGTIFAMRDALIQAFQYLKNIKKLESFMKGKHHNTILVLFEMYTTSNNFTINLVNSGSDFQEVAYRLGLSDQQAVEEELE